MGSGVASGQTNGVIRTKDGKFAKGHMGGPGNPHYRRVLEYRQAIARAATVEKVEEVTNAIIAAALEGDMQAARIILEYTAGKPKQEVELSGDLLGSMNPDERLERLREIFDARRTGGSGQLTSGHSANGNGVIPPDSGGA